MVEAGGHSADPRRTGWVTHERYWWHDLGSAALYVRAGGYVEPDVHVDQPGAKRRLRNLVEVSGLADRLVAIRPREATDEELLRLHTSRYINLVRSLSDGAGGDAGNNALVGPGSFEIAALAAGGCIEAVEAVLEAKVDNAFALVRPPGHHALADQGLGYCLFGNAALAVMHARAKGVARVAVVDWDVHHGNGTQAAFWVDPAVLTISLHQDQHFPHDSGFVEEVGEGAGRGANLNIPLPPASGLGAYRAAFERIVIPALHRFQPELIVVACGFDASALDPLGRQLLYSDGFRALTRLVRTAAETLCGGKLVLCQEGGYSTGYVPFCGLAVLEELSGIRTPVDDPFMAARRGAFAYQELQPHQEMAIRAAEENLRLVPALEPPPQTGQSA